MNKFGMGKSSRPESPSRTAERRRVMESFRNLDSDMTLEKFRALMKKIEAMNGKFMN